jgi:hypothetical protein
MDVTTPLSVHVIVSEHKTTQRKEQLSVEAQSQALGIHN